MFHQAGVLPPQGQATVQGQMVPGIGQLPRYPVDDIMEPMTCTLQVPRSDDCPENYVHQNPMTEDLRRKNQEWHETETQARVPGKYIKSHLCYYIEHALYYYYSYYYYYSSYYYSDSYYYSYYSSSSYSSSYYSSYSSPLLYSYTNTTTTPNYYYYSTLLYFTLLL